MTDIYFEVVKIICFSFYAFSIKTQKMQFLNGTNQI